MTPTKAAIAIAAIIPLTGTARADDITVFAAASMTTAMEQIEALWEEQTDHTATVSLAGSSALARQIQQGAPADVFISANPGWMDTLEDDGAIVPETRIDLLRNRIVLIAGDGGTAGDPPTLTEDFDLTGQLGDGRLAMALVDAVPAGIYGKAALESLGFWAEVEPQVAQADNVRAALQLVTSGAAPMGVVYATDAAAAPSVTVLGMFPEDSHPPIVYPAAAVDGGNLELAETFLDFLQLEGASQVFQDQGFALAGN